MALLPSKANTEDNKQGMDDRSPLPADTYLCQIVKSEMKATKAGTGHYLSVHFKVIEGSSKGRMVFENLNLDNPNPVAVEIANKALNSICQSCGLEGVEDSEELHGIPLAVTVKVEEATAQWPASNTVTAYGPEEEYDGDSAPAEKSEASEPAAPKKKPWEKG